MNCKLSWCWACTHSFLFPLNKAMLFSPSLEYNLEYVQFISFGDLHVEIVTPKDVVVAARSELVHLIKVSGLAEATTCNFH